MAEPADDSRERSAGPLRKHDVMVAGFQEAARGLLPSDRIRLWIFGNSATVVGAASGGEEFNRLASDLQNLGSGTEIGASLSEATQNSEATDVILVTDGKSHSIDVQVLARTGKRFTVVLVGEDSLEANVGYLAALTGGKIFVATGSDADSAIKAAFASIRSRHVVTGRIDGAPYKVTARRAGMEIKVAWGGTAEGEATADARAIAAMAASLAIPALDEDRAAALAEAHGIVCHLTSLVLVDEAGAA
jgi:hypothetical protein